jgi:glycosyltransferase involved in cell wall biosynthesis
MRAELAQRLIRGDRSRQASYRCFEEFGKWFGTRVAARMSRMKLDAAHDIHFAYATGALESVRLARECGVAALVDQVDAGRAHEVHLHEEYARWDGWETQAGAIPDSYFDRLAEEWHLADLVVVNSAYSRRAMHQQGVPLEKIVVVPLAYEPRLRGPATFKRPSSPDKPLEVLFLGQVSLCKGIPYLLQAARLLHEENVHFQVVGPIKISEAAVKSAPPNVTFAGPVLHDQVESVYRAADIFVLPTVSDGFAITQIEAMSCGLPVIATPNCGDVVTDQVDGFLVPVRDPQALAVAIARCSQNRAGLEEMSRQALRKSAQFSLARFAANLEAAALGRQQGQVISDTLRVPLKT